MLSREISEKFSRLQVIQLCYEFVLCHLVKKSILGASLKHSLNKEACMYIFQVHHYIRSDQIETYKAATIENAHKTMLEPGVIRFDVFQDAANPAHFSLLEVYRDLAARDAHLETEHFLKWKDVYLQTQERKGHGDEFNAVFPEGSKWIKN